MTTREKVEKLLDRLSEGELEAEYERLKATVEGERVVDEWGDLSAMTDVAAGETMRRLDEEERAKHGKTIGEACRNPAPSASTTLSWPERHC